MYRVFPASGLVSAQEIGGAGASPARLTACRRGVVGWFASL